jgi:hypothetical protein
MVFGILLTIVVVALAYPKKEKRPKFTLIKGGKKDMFS